MNRENSSKGETTRIFMLVPPQVHLLDLNGPAHIFYEARELGANIDLYYISLNQRNVETSSAGLVLSNLEAFENYTLDANDWLFIPGLDKAIIDGHEWFRQLKLFHQWLLVQNKKGAKICSVCTGAYIIAQSGILKGKRCTTHWKYLDDFASKFPEAVLLRDRLFVKDENIFTTAGVSSGIDLSLYMLEEFFGSSMAAKVAKEVVIYLRRTEMDPQLSIFLQYRNHIENRIHHVQDLLSQNLSQGFRIEDLADPVCMSARNLTRLFKKTTGITIGKYREKLRIERAITLLGQGQKAETVAKDCGLSSYEQLRVMLKRQTEE